MSQHILVFLNFERFHVKNILTEKILDIQEYNYLIFS